MLLGKASKPDPTEEPCLMEWVLTHQRVTPRSLKNQFFLYLNIMKNNSWEVCIWLRQECDSRQKLLMVQLKQVYALAVQVWVHAFPSSPKTQEVQWWFFSPLARVQREQWSRRPQRVVSYNNRHFYSNSGHVSEKLLLYILLLGLWPLAIWKFVISSRQSIMQQPNFWEHSSQGSLLRISLS